MHASEGPPQGDQGSVGPVLAKAYLPLKKHRKIGRQAATGIRTIKIVRDDGGKTVHVLVFRGNRWQNEEIDRKLILTEK